MSISIPKDLPDPREFTGFVFWQKANNWEKYVNSQLEAYNISQSEIFQMISISILLNQQEEVTQVDIANFTGVAAMSVSKVLKKLEKKEFITRETGTDSRAKSLKITQKGLDVLIRSANTLFESNQSFFPTKNGEQFFNYLQQLK
ncbi:transcriptional regulator [Rivularia sp. PCC 7116]|uniref:MarR family transcriptional regulator n=1 Tax=Rivularia sp. PCC 7116 TaxID=373994 RepID=UPI00029F47F6|nr:MarR family transcriptional regulator [Rivularia sp. PCC 7116]AFY56814.1 transcriptional regulator [Rivularia sp. PCC 7116]